MTCRLTDTAGFIVQLTDLLDAKMGSAMKEMRDVARQKVNEPYPPASQPFSPAHKRTGAYRRSLFVSRISKMYWAFGTRRVSPAPGGGDRSLLGLWLEKGTGGHREPFESGSFTRLQSNQRGSNLDTAETGVGGRMAPRPVLMPTLIIDGPRIFAAHFGGAR